MRQDDLIRGADTSQKRVHESAIPVHGFSKESNVGACVAWGLSEVIAQVVWRAGEVPVSR